VAGLQRQPLSRIARHARWPAILVGVVLVLVVGSVAGAWLRDRDGRTQETVARASPVRTLLIEETNRFELSLSPFDPELLNPIPGLKPVAIGHHYVAGTSPNGRALAMIGWPSGASGSGQLQLIDLEPWTVRSTEARVDGSVVALAFSPDGDNLFWPLSPATSSPGVTELMLAAAANGAEIGRVSLPESLIPWDLRPTRNGRIAIFAVGADASWLNNEPPRVLLVDPGTRGLVADLALEGVIAGQRGSQATGFESSRPGLAWDIARGRLYVIDAKDDRLTIVDLDRGQVVAATELVSAQSPLDALGALLVPTAYAKLVPGTDRTAVLDADGRRLYVATLRRTQSDDYRQFDEVALGGFVVDTDTLRIVDRIDQPVSGLALSPDSTRLLATGTDVSSRADEAGVVTPHGLFVLDPASLEELAHIASGGPMRVAGFSPDGRIAYLQSWEDEASGGQECVISSLRLDRLEIAAERRVEGYCDVIATPAS
jgi:hypothetical protein